MAGDIDDTKRSRAPLPGSPAGYRQPPSAQARSNARVMISSCMGSNAPEQELVLIELQKDQPFMLRERRKQLRVTTLGSRTLFWS